MGFDASTSVLYLALFKFDQVNYLFITTSYEQCLVLLSMWWLYTIEVILSGASAIGTGMSGLSRFQTNIIATNGTASATETQQGFTQLTLSPGIKKTGIYEDFRFLVSDRAENISLLYRQLYLNHRDLR